MRFILITIVQSSGEPSKKRRKFATPKLNVTSNWEWVSEFNLDGRIVRSVDEVGDGASSRVYKEFLDDKMVAVYSN